MHLQNWITQARAHWEEFQPTRHKELKEAGQLEQALQSAADQTHFEISQLENTGFSNQEAWEMTRELYLFPPEEGKQPAQASPQAQMQMAAARRGVREVAVPVTGEGIMPRTPSQLSAMLNENPDE